MAKRDDDDDDLFGSDPDPAKNARNEGMRRVVRNNRDWWRSVQWFVRHLMPGWEGTSEDMRLLFYRQGLPPPPGSPNVWGPVATWAMKAGLLDPTGERRPMKTIKSHGRDTPVYRRTKYQAKGD